MAATAYAELHAWSNFTFLEGASHPEESVERALELGLHALALTDRDGLYGMVAFTKAAKNTPLGAICGAELTLDLRRHPANKPLPPSAPHLLLLVQNRTGYAHLTQLISKAQLRGSKRDARLFIEDLEGKTEGLFALSGGRNGLIEQALLREDAAAARDWAVMLRERFGADFYLELQHHLRPEDAMLCRRMVHLSEELKIPYVATNGVVYADPADARLCDVLLCIKHKTSLANAGMLLRPNAEYYLKAPAMMAKLFEPFPRAINNTLAIAERCTFRLDKLAGQFPTYPIPQGEASAHSYLRTLVAAGAAKRYGTPLAEKVERQLEYELGIIARMQLAGYFLVVWDIVRAAEELGVLCQGRGSAANSAVCYALGITAVDPVGLDLLFERFLTEDRQEVPDIDIDFAHQDRERVIQYVYNRYGREHAAMTAEVITYRTRSAIRDVGKAIGLNLAQVDAIAKEYDARESLAGVLGAQEPGERGPIGGEIGARLLAFCRRIDGFPRHMGIHSGGMMITRDPLVQVAPIEWATMKARTIIQWDKDDTGDLGLIKIDLLGLGMLSLLRDAFAMHARARAYGDPKALGPCIEPAHHEHPEAPLSLGTIPNDDQPTYTMLQKADSVGVFQVESRAQQSMLPRLRPKCFYDIVMQVAIIRPGPIQGQMVHPFLRRRNGEEPVTYPHPKLKPILERTLGVPLFQEQGMRMAIEAGGFTPGQADQLRRAMGHKRSRDRMLELYPKLIAGFAANGIDRDAAEQLFHMLEGFADYGFPESHAASFALLAYASAYIKCHYPAIFAAAILNVQPMGFYSTEVLVNDARRHAVVIKRVEVNRSEWWSRVDRQGALRLGYHLVRGMGEVHRERTERALKDGPFNDVIAFARRTGLDREPLENLAAADVFVPWYSTRRDALWAVAGLFEQEQRGELGRDMDVVEPQARFAAIAPREATTLDLYSTGVSPQLQPIAHFREELKRERVLSAAALDTAPNHLVCKVGGMVITRQRPGTAKGFVFLTLEDETGLVNVIVKPNVYEKNRRLVRQAHALVIEGLLQKEQGTINLIARRFWPLETHGTIDGVRSRNFH